MLSTLSAGVWRLNNEEIIPPNTPGGMYRIIYRFEDKLNGEFGIYHGHGDILIRR